MNDLEAVKTQLEDEIARLQGDYEFWQIKLGEIKTRSRETLRRELKQTSITRNYTRIIINIFYILIGFWLHSLILK